MTYKITKIAENNVEVIPHKILKDINLIDFTIFDNENKQSYGQSVIDDELIKAKKELVNANAFDEVTYKKNLIIKAQAKIDKLTLIQTEMDKTL